MTEPNPAEAVVAEAILQVREDIACGILPQGAVMPHVIRRTGATESLYWRAVAFANLQTMRDES